MKLKSLFNKTVSTIKSTYASACALEEKMDARIGEAEKKIFKGRTGDEAIEAAIPVVKSSVTRTSNKVSAAAVAANEKRSEILQSLLKEIEERKEKHASKKGESK